MGARRWERARAPPEPAALGLAPPHAHAPVLGPVGRSLGPETAPAAICHPPLPSKSEPKHGRVQVFRERCERLGPLLKGRALEKASRNNVSSLLSLLAIFRISPLAPLRACFLGRRRGCRQLHEHRRRHRSRLAAAAAGPERHRPRPPSGPLDSLPLWLPRARLESARSAPRRPSEGPSHLPSVSLPARNTRAAKARLASCLRWPLSPPPVSPALPSPARNRRRTRGGRVRPALYSSFVAALQQATALDKAPKAPGRSTSYLLPTLTPPPPLGAEGEPRLPGLAPRSLSPGGKG